jgi:single-stranded DNA-specific DHH superfamily exonuclease
LHIAMFTWDGGLNQMAKGNARAVINPNAIDALHPLEFSCDKCVCYLW